MELETIRRFRTTLRKFERDVAVRQKRDDRTGGLSVVQCHTVINLRELGEVTIGQMADRMGVDKSTLSRTMDGLVDKDLVNRYPHPHDRRFMMVQLTEKGREVCDRLNRINDDYIQRVFSRIPELEHQDVINHFELFVKAMREENKD